MVAILALISGVGAIAAGIGGATLTGIVGGVTTLAGVGAVVGLGGQAIVYGLSSVSKNLATDAISSLVMGSNQFGSVQDYAMSFVLGGVTKYAITGAKKHSKIKKVVLEIFSAPLGEQFVDLMVRGGNFSIREVSVNLVINAMSLVVGNDFGGNLFQSITTKEMARIFNW